MPIKKQLASILSSKTVGSAVMSSLTRKHSSESAMSDVTDGAHYQKVRQNMDKSDITVTVNSDGSPVFNSSSYSIWPIQLALNELPPRLRWNNIMTPVLWYGKEHPDMTLVLQAFVRQLEELNKSGLRWEFAGTVIKSKVFCICCCADSPARAAMQHMVQFNGYYGCSWCYHPGVNVNVDGTVKYCLSTPFPDRKDEEAVQDMRDACNSGAAVRGVKAPSPFINLPGFSPIWSWSPDYMHSILLGVARQITDLWFTATGADYYCGEASKVAIVDKRISLLKLPECIHRRPRALLSRKYWKASEWQCWLLYHSMPCLADVLDDMYVRHWGLLVAGVFLLLKDSVSKADVEQSTLLLTEFVVNVQFLYGKSAMTYNAHQLLHMPKSVLLFGPLRAHSCFVFENSIGKLLKLVTSSNGVAIQIATRLLCRVS
ncbi:hypothetical protein MTO96_003239 [Rhipicephalus appendiculatus]